jgi:hypothetical protein
MVAILVLFIARPFSTVRSDDKVLLCGDVRDALAIAVPRNRQQLHTFPVQFDRDRFNDIRGP